MSKTNSQPQAQPQHKATDPNSGALKYTEGNLQRVTKLCMEASIQGQANRLGPDQQSPHERPLKARFPDLYYGKSHIEFYHFCQ